MSENKNYMMIKVTPSDVLFDLHPVSNFGLTRRIYLNSRTTKQALPQDWALGVFQDPAVYEMYRQGYFTFDDNDAIVKAAFEAGVYFDEKLDFEPAKPNCADEILLVLKSGNRANITKTIDKYGKETVLDVCKLHINELQQGVVSMLENTLNVQLIIDEQ